MRFKYEEDLYPHKFYLVKGSAPTMEVRKNAREWCKENAQGAWSVDFFTERAGYTSVVVQFELKSDAMMFKLGYV